jgi:hypothetical protein
VRTSLPISIASASIATPREPASALARLMDGIVDFAAAVLRGRSARRRPSSWAGDLPWDCGMDRLAEQAYRPWILRP